MTSKSILVTGGAGFIGSFLVDRLVSLGHKVRIIDNLDPQVHPNSIIPSYLNKDAEFIFGDIRDRDKLEKALSGIHYIFHMASAVGVGQSQYEIDKYVDVNCHGTAQLWDIILKKKLNIGKVIVPSSMTCFGEGLSLCQNCGTVKPHIRQSIDNINKVFSCLCPTCNMHVKPIATPSDSPMYPSSIYAYTKKFQEDISLNLSRTHSIPCTIFRYFNVYGPRQSLSNPYTGVSAIFISRIKNNKPPIIFEDGLQTRDFISVHDVTAANIKAIEDDTINFSAINLGSGQPTSIKDLGTFLINLLNANCKIEINLSFRKGDIRHCYADRHELSSRFGFSTKISLEDGLTELATWAKHEEAIDKSEIATSELINAGIINNNK
ncbi:MAG: hypothetical protein A2293_16535 [Elusimicrobia bacterium RIFOXYB2_FULL_49_7]|nr:MAG: hypothetical protein A2293_16535 [Elusimicrobia bacterium RIFOXYB2_FULL_49_7]